MKNSHIIAIIMIVAAIGIFINSGSDTTSFSSFREAEVAGKTVKVSGDLVKSKEMYYNPREDANFFSFYMSDDEGEVRQVVLRNEKPQDFERSENIVVTGKMQDGKFLASDMLLKCPSKYKDEEVFVKSKTAALNE